MASVKQSVPLATNPMPMSGDIPFRLVRMPGHFNIIQVGEILFYLVTENVFGNAMFSGKNSDCLYSCPVGDLVIPDGYVGPCHMSLKHV